MSRERQTATPTEKLLPPKKKQKDLPYRHCACRAGAAAGARCLCCVFCWFSPCFAQSGVPWRRWALSLPAQELFYLGFSLCLGTAGSSICCAMSIKGEVRVRKMHWLPLASFNQGRYVIRPFECTLTGKDDGYARVKASIHVHLTTFDEEEWRIITLVVAHLDSSFMCTDLFEPNCGPIGEFTDIKMIGNGYVFPKDMREYNFPVRNFDGSFYAQIYPFDPFHFSTKVHPTGALLFTPHHSQLTLLQHLILHDQFAKKPLTLLSTIPKYWLEDDATMGLSERYRWRSAKTIRWLKLRGLASVPRTIREELGALVYSLDKCQDSAPTTTPPGRWRTDDKSRASDDPPPRLQ